MVQFIHEYSTHMRTPAGQTYIARTYGKPQLDGTWVGWLEFSPLDTPGPVLRTDRETSQTNRDALETWALGLESTYLEGAFERARLVE
jgi:hypothetical protein